MIMKNNKVSIYLLFMDLLVASKNDPAGHNMSKFISQKMEKDGDLYHGNYFDLIEIDSPTISADWSVSYTHLTLPTILRV